MTEHTYVIDDRERSLFKVHRSVFVDPVILAKERDKIFNKCWQYIGHESEVAKPGDFQSRWVGGRPVVFCRGNDGVVRAFLNSCTHRGTMVCRERRGNSRTFQCFYHAWTFSNTGELVAVPGEDAYGPCFNKADFRLREVPRLEDYRGFYFVNFDPQAQPLHDYLAGAKEYLDLII
ncbi:MAG: Rieske 2Fe-2S domain-containing protein, partial [Alicyclobacillus sp.]|nr:Rieske 2Fe-2S domain-containing protein [Alicyclobacillus sp.]